MSKRFIDNIIWSKAEFRRASTKHKLLFLYVIQNCDCIGIWEGDYELASFQIGENISEEDILMIPCEIEKLKSGKFWLPKFCTQQYGKLSDKCKPHIRYKQELLKYGLLDRVSIGYTKGTSTLEEEEEEKEEEKERDNSISYSIILDSYNKYSPPLPKILSRISEKRKKSLKARLSHSEMRTSEFWDKYFRLASSSPFLLGENEKNWKASFDWLLNEHNMEKVLENKYNSSKGGLNEPAQRNKLGITYPSDARRKLNDHDKRNNSESTNDPEAIGGTFEDSFRSESEKGNATININFEGVDLP